MLIHSQIWGLVILNLRKVAQTTVLWINISSTYLHIYIFLIWRLIIKLISDNPIETPFSPTFFTRLILACPIRSLRIPWSLRLLMSMITALYTLLEITKHGIDILTSFWSIVNCLFFVAEILIRLYVGSLWILYTDIIDAILFLLLYLLQDIKVDHVITERAPLLCRLILWLEPLANTFFVEHVMTSWYLSNHISFLKLVDTNDTVFLIEVIFMHFQKSWKKDIIEIF